MLVIFTTDIQLQVALVNESIFMVSSALLFGRRKVVQRELILKIENVFHFCASLLPLYMLTFFSSIDLLLDGKIFRCLGFPFFHTICFIQHF